MSAGRIVRFAIVVGIVVTIAIAIAVVVSPSSFFDAEEKNLASSLADDVSGGAGICTLQPDRGWYWCEVEVDPGSGVGAAYVLRTTDGGCWSADLAELRRVKGSKNEAVTVETKPRDSREGCVGLMDFVWPSALGDGSGQPLSLRG